MVSFKNADTERLIAGFIQWDIPPKKQTTPCDDIKTGSRARLNKSHTVLTCVGDAAEKLIRAEPVTYEDADGLLLERPFNIGIKYNDAHYIILDKEWTMKILKCMNSDYVKLYLYKTESPAVIAGDIDGIPTAALIAPRVEDDDA